MSKATKSFTVDEQLAEIMSEDNQTNWSGVVNDLLDAYIAEGRTDQAALQQRLERARDKRDAKRREYERFNAEVKRLESAIESEEESLNQTINTVADTFGGNPDVIDADHVAAKRIANQFDITAEQAAKRIKGRLS